LLLLAGITTSFNSLEETHLDCVGATMLYRNDGAQGRTERAKRRFFPEAGNLLTQATRTSDHDTRHNASCAVNLTESIRQPD
jgi:hypothetical protein